MFLVSLIIAFFLAAPGAADSLPRCAVEDGAGVAFCSWDGVVSGDCAPDFVGGIDTSAICIQKHLTNPKETTKCVEIFNLSDKPVTTLRECFVKI